MSPNFHRSRSRIASGLLLLVSGMALTAGCMPCGTEPLDTVAFVDVQRYLGTWYEIASYPAWFQEGCVGSTAEYSLRDDDKINVINRCFDESFEGELRTVEGVARVVDEQTNARLKVSFFGPFEGDYYIIDLDPDYQWAVVGEPTREYLWILSRTPTMDDALYQSILSRLPEKGYDPSRLELTPQRANP